MAIYSEDADYSVSQDLAKGHRMGEPPWLACNPVVFGSDLQSRGLVSVIKVWIMTKIFIFLKYLG